MSVSASFQPEQLDAVPGQATSLSLHVHNNSNDEQVITLRPSGELADQTLLATQSVQLDGGEHFEIPVTLDTTNSLLAGGHVCAVDVVANDVTTTATAAVEVAADVAWTARLEPHRSSSPTRGRHRVTIENRGNTPVSVEVTAVGDGDIVPEIAAPSVDLASGSSARIALRVKPDVPFWTGPVVEHAFAVVLRTGDETQELTGTYQQGPRLRPWVVPALIGMFGSLALGTLAWFTLLRPAVEDIAREEAAILDLAQQELLDERVEAVQAAAEEASQLPLGEPTDLRMTASAAAGNTSTDAFDFDKAGAGRLFSISDIIFQNPTGAIGRLELLRDEEVLLDQEMANFRDLDFHFVAPFQVNSQSTISLRVTCETPGPGTDECQAAATIIGFVDDL